MLRMINSDNVEKRTIFISDEWFHMMNFISSRSNSRDYERQCKNLFREASAYKAYSGYQTTFGVGLSGTPLNEAIVTLNYIIPEFKNRMICRKLMSASCLTVKVVLLLMVMRFIWITKTNILSVLVALIIIRFFVIVRLVLLYEQFDAENVTNIFIQQLRDRNPDVKCSWFPYSFWQSTF